MKLSETCTRFSHFQNTGEFDLQCEQPGQALFLKIRRKPDGTFVATAECQIPNETDFPIRCAVSSLRQPDAKSAISEIQKTILSWDVSDLRHRKFFVEYMLLLNPWLPIPNDAATLAPTQPNNSPSPEGEGRGEGSVCSSPIFHCPLSILH